jgi:hypothetical protein
VFKRLSAFAFAFAFAYSTYLCLAVAALISTYVSTVPVPGTKLRKTQVEVYVDVDGQQT